MAIPLTQAIQETLQRDLASGVWTQTTRQFMAQIGQPLAPGVGVTLLGPLTLGAGQTLLFTATGATQITSMRLVNVGMATYQVAVYLVPPAGVPGPPNRVLQRNLSAGEHYECPEILGATMIAGAMLYAEVATAGVIRVLASGRPIP